MPEDKTINKKDAKNGKDIKHVLSSLPTSCTDIIGISIRNDNSVLLQLLSILPEDIIENHRTIMRHDDIIELINNLCEATQYYPSKPKNKSPKKI